MAEPEEVQHHSARGPLHIIAGIASESYIEVMPKGDVLVMWQRIQQLEKALEPFACEPSRYEMHAEDFYAAKAAYDDH
jgi:hypothetical protein